MSKNYTTNLVSKMFKNLLIIFFFTILLIFFAEKIINFKTLRTTDKIFHHKLNDNIKNYKNWGVELFDVCTDGNGFKISCDDFNDKKINKQFDIGIIGDSFTEAQFYEESFVGLISKKYKNLKIANLGVASYSPSIYFFKIKHLLDEGYSFKHIIVFIDISDVQDEAIYEEKKGRIISKYKLNAQFHQIEKISIIRKIKNFIMYNFPFLYSKIYKIKSANTHKTEYFKNIDKDNIIYQKKYPRSSWTYNKDMKFRKNITVKKMLDKSERYMTSLYNLLKSKNIKLSVGVYPWPGQILWDDKNNLQSKFWDDFCVNRCDYYFNNFDFFFDYSKEYGKWETIEKFYIINDVHFNKFGHQVIADNFIKKFHQN